MIDFSSVRWRKSSHSGGQSGQCVEVAKVVAAVGIQDSRNPEGGHLVMDQVAFGDLLARVKAGVLDL